MPTLWRLPRSMRLLASVCFLLKAVGTAHAQCEAGVSDLGAVVAPGPCNASNDCTGSVACTQVPVPLGFPVSQTRVNPSSFDLGATGSTCYVTSGEVLGAVVTQGASPDLLIKELLFFTDAPAIDLRLQGQTCTFPLTGCALHAAGATSGSISDTLVIEAHAVTDRAISVLVGGELKEYTLPSNVLPVAAGGVVACDPDIGNFVTLCVQLTDDSIHCVLDSVRTSYQIPEAIVAPPESYTNGPLGGLLVFGANSAYRISAGQVCPVPFSGTYISHTHVADGVEVTTTEGTFPIDLVSGAGIVPFASCDLPMTACASPATIAMNYAPCTRVNADAAGWPPPAVAGSIQIPTISMKFVEVNGVDVPGGPTSDLTALPRDVLTAEIFVQDWSYEFRPCVDGVCQGGSNANGPCAGDGHCPTTNIKLGAFQWTIDFHTLTSGLAGNVFYRGLEGDCSNPPLPENLDHCYIDLKGCADDDDPAGSDVGIWSDGGCVGECLTAPCQADNPWIIPYVFQGLNQFVPHVTISCDYSGASALLSPESAPVSEQDGTEFYLGTVILEVSFDARGTFTVCLTNHPNLTFLLCDSGARIAPLAFECATVTVPIGSCCTNVGGPNADCIPELTEDACFRHPNQPTAWNGGRVCTGDPLLDCQSLTPTGACCLPSNTCTEATALCCTDQHGGMLQGIESTCGGLEACTLSAGTCVIADALCCVNVLGGTTQGPGSTCGGIEACALPDETCVIADALSCVTELAGTPQGPGSTCGGLEACCDSVTEACSVIDRNFCLADGDTPQGPGSTCAGNPCVPPPACGDGSCTASVFENCCSCPEDCGPCCGNGVCDNLCREDCSSCPEDCDPPEGEECMPTMSEWGLVILILALLTGIAIKFGLRRRPSRGL